MAPPLSASFPAEPWLADVGFGDSFLDPLKLEPGLEQRQQNGAFRVVQNDADWLVERLPKCL